MSSWLTDAERDARLAADTSSPDALVYVMLGRHSKRRMYHTRVDCKHLVKFVSPGDGKLQGRPRRHIQNRGCVPCVVCHDLDGIDSQSHGGYTIEQTCPFCGEEIGLLPPHLVKCADAPRGHGADAGGAIDD